MPRRSARRFYQAASGLFVPSAAVATTWNASDANANVTLTGGNLTTEKAVVGNGAAGVRGTTSASSGKKYHEITLGSYNANTADGLGFGNATESLSAFVGVASTNSVGWYDDGSVKINNSAIGTAVTWGTNGQVLCFAIDIDALKIWLRLNGGNWNNDVIANQNPATGAGGFSLSTLAAGPYFPMLNVWFSGGDRTTANFGATAYAQTAPAGFGNW